MDQSILRSDSNRARRRSSFLTAALIAALTLPSAWARSEGDVRFLLAGDILLSRLVEVEIQRSKEDPWIGLRAFFHGADWVAGNLEGAVGFSSDCISRSPERPCFAVRTERLAELKAAGFSAIGVENNHRADLGDVGRSWTIEGLADAGLMSLSYDSSPVFISVGDVVLGVVAFTNVPDVEGRSVPIPSVELRRKLRLAKALANLVVVYVHWGQELLDWASDGQERAARWLVENGADLIVGHHTHVVQEALCIDGRPVFMSLGNLLFDQKFPETRRGLMVDCRIRGRKLQCGGIETKADSQSPFPRVLGRWKSVDSALASCTPSLHQSLTLGGIRLAPVEIGEGTDSRVALEGFDRNGRKWTSEPVVLLDAEASPFGAAGTTPFLFTLERAQSQMDLEEAPRPHVYEVTPSGLRARWRGTSLAFPLVDAEILPGNPTALCALHRGDSFLLPNPATTSVRVGVYRWNGFGFSGFDSPADLRRCEAYYELPPPFQASPTLAAGRETSHGIP